MFKIVEKNETKTVSFEELKTKIDEELLKIYFETSQKIEDNELEIENLKQK